jgi:hypothetical protein
VQILSGAVLTLAGVALCVWSALSPGISWDAGGPHATPRFYLGVAWTLCGIIIMFRARRGGKR